MTEKQASTRRNWLRISMRLLGPLILVMLLLQVKDPGQIWDILRQADPLLLMSALALNALVVHLKVQRWRTLLASQGYPYSQGRAGQAFLASLYLGLLTPGRIGDMIRIQYVRNDLHMPYSAGLATSVVDRLCDFYVLLIFVTFGIAHFASIFGDELLAIAVAACMIMALTPLLLLIPKLADGFLGRIYARVAQDRDAAGLSRFLAALRLQLGWPQAIAVPLTVAAFLVNYLQGWLTALALGHQLSYIDVAAMLSVTSLLSLLPISISGVGVRELFLALLFPVLGFSAEQGVAYGLGVFVVMYLVLLIPGFIAWQLAPPEFDVKRN